MHTFFCSHTHAHCENTFLQSAFFAFSTGAPRDVIRYRRDLTRVDGVYSSLTTYCPFATFVLKVLDQSPFVACTVTAHASLMRGRGESGKPGMGWAAYTLKATSFEARMIKFYDLDSNECSIELFVYNTEHSVHPHFKSKAFAQHAARVFKKHDDDMLQQMRTLRQQLARCAVLAAAMISRRVAG